jgi:hypothetical protein
MVECRIDKNVDGRGRGSLYVLSTENEYFRS